LAIVADAECNWMMSLVSTNDGGDTWNPVVLPFKKLDEKKLFEAGKFTGVICFDEDNNEFFYRSDNGGKTWETKSLPGKYYNPYFIDEKIGFIGGYQTKDGGDTWQISTVPFGNSSIIHFSDEKEGFVINGHEEWLNCSECDVPSLIYFESYETKDAGKSWIKTQIDKGCGFYTKYLTKGGDALYYIGGNDSHNGFVVKRFDLK
jgi:photosystem II stability/assembly factor-like uncharacterized protein